MNVLLTYLIQSSISLTVFYIGYEILFKREVYFQFIRYYFLFAIIISVFLPLSNINVSQTFFESYDMPIYAASVPDFMEYSLGEVVVYADSPDGIVIPWYERVTLFGSIATIYIIGVTFFTLIFLVRIGKLTQLFYSHRNSYSRKSSIISIPGIPAFSFFNFIFIDKDNLNNDDAKKIIAHENVHIKQKHTLDIIIAELFVILQWFNPAAHIIMRKIKENHEFIADNSVVGYYGDKLEYSRILIENSSIIKTNILTHNFSYSLLKRRLFMIKKTKNPYLFSLKLMGVVIVIGLVSFACSGPVSNEGMTVNDTDKSVKSEMEVHSKVEVMPQYPGGNDELVSYLAGNITYPQEAMDNDIEGKVIVSFIVEKDGNISNTKVIDGIGYGCDEEAVRVISGMPNWTPGMKNNKAVNVSFKLPISFKLEEKDNDTVFMVVEDMPSFPGGQKALMNYIASNIEYPEKAKNDKVSGRVFVSFVVEKDGSIGDVELLRGIGSGCDQEAIRVVSSMPNWEPGKQGGKPVRVKYNLPIKYQLD